MPITVGKRTFRIRKSSEFNEYSVTQKEDNVILDALTYYTDDYDDAVETMVNQIIHYVRSQKDAFKVSYH